MSNPTNLRTAFMYGFGRSSAAGAHFSVQAMRIDLARSAQDGRLVAKGNVGAMFKKAGEGNRNSHGTGGYHIAWAEAEDMAVVKMRGESTRRGYASHIGEVYILLHKQGPVFNIDMAIPRHEDFPSEELRIFSGAGWLLSVDDLEEMRAVPRVTDQMLETIFWKDKDQEEDVYDSGLFTYEEEQPALASKPKLTFTKGKSTGKKAVEVPVFLPDTRMKRRIVVPRKG